MFKKNNSHEINLLVKLNFFVLNLSILLIILMLVFGSIWIWENWNFIPQYGDTAEYVALSKTLEVDQYRGIVYPFLLYTSQQVSEHFNIVAGFVPIVYFIQLILLVSSSIILCISLLYAFNNVQLNYKYAIACAIVTSFNPLSLHFAFTILTDSICASLIMLQAACLINASSINLQIKKFVAWIIIWLLITIILSNLRVEKQYLSWVVFVAVGLLIVLNTRENFRLSKSILLVLIFTMTFFLSISIQKATTVPNLERPDLSITNLLFNRTVWPRLSSTLSHLPANIKSTITEDEAKRFDSHNNHVFPFQAAALRDPTKGAEYLNTIALSAIQNFYPDIIFALIFDFGKYLLPGIAFPLEAIGILPESPATSWTISRATMASPELTSFYLWIGSIFYFMVIGLAIIKLKKNRLKQKNTLIAVVIICFYLLANSGLFAVAFGQHAHIRYALPTYILTLNLLLVFIMSTDQKITNNNNRPI